MRQTLKSQLNDIFCSLSIQTSGRVKYKSSLQGALGEARVLYITVESSVLVSSASFLAVSFSILVVYKRKWIFGACSQKENYFK